MQSFSQALDSANQLSLSEKEMLVEILKKQMIEEKRKELALKVKEAEALYQADKLESTDSTKAINELHQSLSEKEEN